MRSLLPLIFLLLSSALPAQQQFLDTLKVPAGIEGNYVRALYSDSLVSSFAIVIKKEVKKHKHVHHAEHVYILEGAGEMILGDKILQVKKGDVIFIPKGTPHAVKVTSKKPMKVISVQAPYFDGKDRVPVD
ncbi:MAG: Cupin domain protein [Bacteroidetes bacterium]|nr:MAG: Cupin domain protein [Bacteroidota bacterium]